MDGYQNSLLLHSAIHPDPVPGGWSYSLYLAHGLVPYVVIFMGFTYLLERASTHWLFVFVSLVASYGFFLLIERPCHILALKAGQAVKGRSRLALK
jgi:peptidoglycan/LPS O-acetylase OafA/YrhL